MKRFRDWISNWKSQRKKTWTEYIDIFETPTPVTRYVNLLLIQISKTSSSNYVIKRSDKLAPMTVGSEIIEPPSLDEVLTRLEELFDLKHRDFQEAVEGTLNLTIHENDFEKKDYVAYIRFDNKSDECCHIRMVRTNKEPSK